MKRRLLHRGIRIDDLRHLAFRRPLMVFPATGRRTFPLCPAAEEKRVKRLPEGTALARLDALGLWEDGTPAARTPVAGTLEGYEIMELPRRGAVLCAHLQAEAVPQRGYAVGRSGKRERTAGTVLRAADTLQLWEEISGKPLGDWIREQREQKVSVLICDALCDDPYLADGLCTLTELTEEVMDGLRLAALAVGCTDLLTAVYRPWEAGLSAARHLRRQLQGVELLEVSGKYPLWPQIPKMDRFRGHTVGRIGPQACMAISRAMRLDKLMERCIVTVSGDAVERPQNFSVPVGTPVSALLADMELNPAEKVTVVAGSSYTGEVIRDPEVPVLPETRGILLFSRSTMRNMTPCTGCGRCLEVCCQQIFVTAAVNAIHRNDREEAGQFGAFRCIGCRACDVICPAGRRPSEILLNYQHKKPSGKD